MWDKQLQTVYVLHYCDYSSVGKAGVCHIRGCVLYSGMNEFKAKLVAVYQKLPACLAKCCVCHMNNTAALWKQFVDRAKELQTEIIRACGEKTIVSGCCFLFCGAVRMYNHN